MAVIDDVEGLEVQILVDGVALREFEEPADTNTDDEKNCTRYIIAQPGKEFVVLVRGTDDFLYGPPEWDICANVKIDGKKAKGALYNKRYGGPLGSRRIEGIDVEDKITGKWVRKCFMFSDLVFDNDMTTSKDQLKRANALGEIEVDIEPGEIGERLETRQCFGIDFASLDKIHEKSLKGRAISHHTSLSNPKPSSAPSVSEFSPRLAGSIAKFKFKYRSERDLKAEMIIPRSPTPVPLEDRPIEDLTPEEMRELLRRKRENGTVKPEGSQRIKRERNANGAADADVDDDDDEVEIVNPPPKRAKVIETVDLTGD